MKKEKMKKKKKVEEENSRKSVRWSAVPVPCLSRLCLKLRGEQGSGLKGVDDLCFHTWGIFSSSSSGLLHPFVPPLTQILAMKPNLKRRGRRKFPICVKA